MSILLVFDRPNCPVIELGCCFCGLFRYPDDPKLSFEKLPLHAPWQDPDKGETSSPIDHEACQNTLNFSLHASYHYKRSWRKRASC